MTKTTAGLFERLPDAQAAAGELLDRGYRAENITLIAHPQAEHSTQAPLTRADIREDSRISTATRALAGGIVGGTAGVLAAAVALAIPGVGLALATGPALSVLLGAAAGAVGGGLIGALTHVGISDEHAHIYAEGVRRGMALLAVSDTEMRAHAAAEILQRHGAVDLDQYAGAWRARGWSGFSPATPPLSAAEIAAQRADTPGTRGPTRIYENAGMAGAGTAQPGQPAMTSQSALSVNAQGVQSPASLPRRGTGSDAFDDNGATGDRFRQHFATNYAHVGARFEDYRFAYQFGYGLHMSGHVAGDNWDAAEAETRAQWEREYPGTWDRYRLAIRYGWDVSAPGVAPSRPPLRGESRLRD